MTLKADFINGTSGKLLVTSWPPLMQPSSLLIVIQPFAEEQNKLRHIFSSLATKLQQYGWHTVILDNYGTGDSEGDLDTASCSIWNNDLLELLKHFKAEGYSSVNFIAARFGCLQLFDFFNRYLLPMPVTHIILWQPIFEITKFWQQLTRLKVAEAMANGEKTSQSTLEQILNSGSVVEIAGYPISPFFFESLMQMQCLPPGLLSKCNVTWFETSLSEKISLSAQHLREKMSQKTSLNFIHLHSAPYWQSNELINTDTLIKLTVEKLTKDKP